MGLTAAAWDHSAEARRVVDPDRLGEKSPEETRVTLAHIMGSADTNLYGSVHGGVVMKLVDDAAGAAAARHAGGPAVTVSVDGMTFLHPAHVGDLLQVTATVAHAGRTSMDVVVEVRAERWNDAGPRQDIVRAFLTFVAVDQDGQPRPVPGLITCTPQERRLVQEAVDRRARRR